MCVCVCWIENTNHVQQCDIVWIERMVIMTPLIVHVTIIRMPHFASLEIIELFVCDFIRTHHIIIDWILFAFGVMILSHCCSKYRIPFQTYHFFFLQSRTRKLLHSKFFQKTILVFCFFVFFSCFVCVCAELISNNKPKNFAWRDECNSFFNNDAARYILQMHGNEVGSRFSNIHLSISRFRKFYFCAFVQILNHYFWFILLQLWSFYTHQNNSLVRWRREGRQRKRRERERCRLRNWSKVTVLFSNSMNCINSPQAVIYTHTDSNTQLQLIIREACATIMCC